MISWALQSHDHCLIWLIIKSNREHFVRQILRLTLMRVAEGVTGSLDATKTLGCNRSGGYDIFRPFLSRYLFRVIQNPITKKEESDTWELQQMITGNMRKLWVLHSCDRGIGKWYGNEIEIEIGPQFETEFFNLVANVCYVHARILKSDFPWFLHEHFHQDSLGNPAWHPCQPQSHPAAS